MLGYFRKNSLEVSLRPNKYITKFHHQGFTFFKFLNGELGTKLDIFGIFILMMD
jgi:hypothetical protein